MRQIHIPAIIIVLLLMNLVPATADQTGSASTGNPPFRIGSYCEYAVASGIAGERAAPTVLLNHPLNKSVFIRKRLNITLNATFRDPDGDHMTVRVFAGNRTGDLDEHGLVHQEDRVADGATVTCPLDSVPLVPDPGTVLLMHFDNRSVYGEHHTLAHDFSGNGNHGSTLDFDPNNGDGNTPPLFNTTGGKFAGSFDLDGLDDYISIPHSPEFNSVNRSLEGWIRSDRVVQTTFLMGRENTGLNGSFMKLCYNWNVILMYVGNTTDEVELAYVLPPGIGVWHHVACTYDGRTAKLYVDGILRANATITNGTNNINRPWVIGADPKWYNWGFFDGTIDEVAVYNRTLTGDEIHDHYRIREGTYFWHVNASDGSTEIRSGSREFFVDATDLGIGFSHPGHRIINVTSNTTYEITLTNTGEVYDNYTLAFNNVNNASTAEMSRTAISLAPGFHTNVILKIGDPDPGKYEIVLSATSEKNSNITDAVTITTHSILDTLAIGTYDAYNLSKGFENISIFGGNVFLFPIGASDVCYPSKYLPMPGWITDTFAREKIDTAHRMGFKAYAWWGMPHDHWLEPGRHPEWISVLSNGTATNCTTNDYFHRIIPPSRVIRTPEYLAQLKGVIKELVDLGFDGIDINDNFQFLNDASFDNFTVSAFMNDTGLTVIGSTLAERALYIKTNLWDAWHSWRAEQVTELLRLMQQYIRDAGSSIPLRPHLMVGHTHYTDWGYDLEGICSAVDVPYAMVGMGPESISHSLGLLREAGAKRIDTSLYLDSIAVGDEGWLAENMEAVKESGAREINLFNYGMAEWRDLWETIRLAVNLTNNGCLPEVMIGQPRYGLSPTYVTQSMEIGFTLSDDDNGTASIWYRLDSGDWKEYTGNFSINEHGHHTIQFYSSNYIGCEDALGSFEVFVDATTPITQMMIGEPNVTTDMTYITPATELNLTASDTEVGVEKIWYAIDGGIWEEYKGNFTVPVPGPHSLSYYATNNLGINETVRTLEIFVDAEPPRCFLAVGPPRHGKDPMYVTNSSEFTLSALDNGSGLSSIFFRIDNGDWGRYFEAFTIIESGAHTVSYYAGDNLSQEGEVKTYDVFVDAGSPETNITFGEPFVYSSSYFITTATPVNLSSKDEGAGVSSILYEVDGGKLSEYQGNFTIDGSGPVTIRYHGLDNVGNNESINSLDIYLDNTPPSLNVTPGSNISGMIELEGGGNITLNASDEGVGGVKILFSIDGGNTWNEYIDPIMVENNMTIHCRAVDALGNRGSDEILKIVVMRNETVADDDEDDDNDDEPDDDDDTPTVGNGTDDEGDDEGEGFLFLIAIAGMILAVLILGFIFIHKRRTGEEVDTSGEERSVTVEVGDMPEIMEVSDGEPEGEMEGHSETVEKTEPTVMDGAKDANEARGTTKPPVMAGQSDKDNAEENTEPPVMTEENNNDNAGDNTEPIVMAGANDADDAGKMSDSPNENRPGIEIIEFGGTRNGDGIEGEYEESTKVV